ncbi:ABC transporter ATP-binding protein [Rhodopseudomonas palustris]|uniref:ABC transporter ATP-binding protein n=1 Tax=Rhodopseudomonas palustris TaxID=1076 RepID=A0A418V0Q9_RHOPL|nr:ABC transporter ATP-binding protein [Rhodopseudomonas palustris]RJF69403.1 ABC transporter ATP-binding protein [Rhodopseudomonas palustris]
MTAILKVCDVSKAFSGVHAVRGASFEVEQGSITGLIGPNGSGKSTTIDCISGFQRLDGGRVLLGDRDITGLRPAEIAKAGMIRTFQNVRVYDSYSLLDNLLVAEQAFRDLNWFDALARTPRYRKVREAAEDQARGLIELVGLTRLIDAPATVLSYGQKKLLAFAAAMMAKPRLIVLDEPVAGVNPSRVNEVADILREANATGISFLIVEHNVEFINSLCGKVIVLEQGRKLTEGTPALIRNDPRVLEAYLGIAPAEADAEAP